MTKQGDGILVLAGDNNYSGGTTITAGELRAANSTGSATGSATGSGAVNVNTGILSGTGTGTVAGAVTVGPQGTIRAGNATADGALTLGNNLTIGSGGTLSTKLLSATATANSLAIGGTFAFDPTGKVRIDATL